MFYGYVIAGVASVATVATSPGQSFLVGKFFVPLQDHLGLDADAPITTVYGLATFCAAIPLMLTGNLADRFGPRVMMGVSSLMLGVACVGITQVSSLWTLGLAFFGLRFFGQGVLGLSASHALALWFERRLGTLTGIKSLAMPLAQGVLPGMITVVIASQGWQVTYALLGVIVWVSVLPLVVFVHRDRPEDIGQRVDGEPAEIRAEEHEPAHAHPEDRLLHSLAVTEGLDDIADHEGDAGVETGASEPRASTAAAFTLSQALSTRAYWIITGCLCASAIIGTAIVFLMEPMVVSAGLVKADGDRLFLVFGLVSAAFTIPAGMIVDRVHPRWVMSSATAGLALSCAILGVSTSFYVSACAMIALALGQVMAFLGSVTLLARFFGRAHHGVIRSSLGTFTVMGTSIGPYLFAKPADVFGDYTVPLIASAALTAPLALFAIALKPPKPFG